MSDTPETDATIDRVDAAMQLIEIIRFERNVALRERDEEREITFRQADCIEELERERDEWRKCAERLILYAREARSKAVADKWEFARINTDIARFERLKEAGK